MSGESQPVVPPSVMTILTDEYKAECHFEAIACLSVKKRQEQLDEAQADWNQHTAKRYQLFEYLKKIGVAEGQLTSWREEHQE